MLVFLVAGFAIQWEKDPARVDLVQIIFFDRVGSDAAIVADEQVNVTLDMVIVPGIAGLVPYLLDGLMDQPVFVMPAEWHIAP